MTFLLLFVFSKAKYSAAYNSIIILKGYPPVINYPAASGIITGLVLFVLTMAMPSQARSENTFDFLAFSLGYYDTNDNKEAIDLRVEYRFGRPLILDIKPWAGFEITTDGAVYGAGGLLYDWQITDHFYLVPSIGAGFYHDRGGKDLGHTIEFRTQLELQYELEDNSRFSIGYSHISNASLSDRNPGAEILSFYYIIPFDKIF